MSSENQPEPQRRDERRPEGERRPWIAPAVIQYGSFRKLTQSMTGSTGEAGNFTMRSCL